GPIHRPEPEQMSAIAIQVEGLGKEYRLGGRRRAYNTLRDQLTDLAGTPLQAIRSLARRSGRRRSRGATHYALRGIPFEVRQGDVLGVIGRNGAGKSTLLKILARITEPTEGYADVRGSVASLLEVGTGFHPELTGRENIYLSGAILGMRRFQIA